MKMLIPLLPNCAMVQIRTKMTAMMDTIVHLVMAIGGCENERGESFLVPVLNVGTPV